MFRKTRGHIQDLITLQRLLFMYREGIVVEPKLLKSTYNTGHSVRNVFLEFSAPVSNLVFDVIGQGAVSIIETPHYEAALWIAKNGKQGSLKFYSDYLCNFFPNESVEDHLQAFELLFGKLNLQRSGMRLLVRRDAPANRKFHVLDGTHRAAILAVLKEPVVTVAMESAYQEKNPRAQIIPPDSVTW